MTLERREKPVRFDKFTERTRMVLMKAKDAARFENSSTVEIRHFVYGLTQKDGGVAERVLGDLVEDLELFRHGVSVEVGDEINSSGVATEVELSDQVIKIINYSVDEARKLGHHYVGTEHLLLGTLRLAKEKPILAFETFDVTYEKAKAKTEEFLAKVIPSKPETKPSATRMFDLSRYLFSLKDNHWKIQVVTAPGITEACDVEEIGYGFVVIKKDDKSIIAVPTNLATFRLSPPEN